jgi:hypothetical protein
VRPRPARRALPTHIQAWEHFAWRLIAIKCQSGGPEVIRRLVKCFNLAAARHPLPPLLWPELLGRVIQDRKRRASKFFAPPLLKQTSLTLVSLQACSSRQHQIRTRGSARMPRARASPEPPGCLQGSMNAAYGTPLIPNRNWTSRPLGHGSAQVCFLARIEKDKAMRG